MRLAREIKYEELSKSFALIDDDLWRRTNKGYKRIENKPDDSGYIQLGWGKYCYYIHRLIYCLASTKDLPIDMQIDHINGIRNDNRPFNLRLVTQRQNNQNKEMHREGHLLGTVFLKDRGLYQSSIRINNIRVWLGYFETEREANTIHKRALELMDEYGGDNDKFRRMCNPNYEDIKGYSFHKATNKWQVRIQINGNRICLGDFEKEKEAQEIVKIARENKHLYKNKKQFRELVKANLKKA